MRTLNTRKKTVISLIRGIYGLYLLQLVLFVTLLSLQSCENEIDQETEVIHEEFLKFENVLQKVASDMEDNRLNGTLLSRASHIEKNKSQQQIENEMTEVVQPLIDGTKRLLSSLGIPEDEYIQEFKGQDDPTIALMGMALLDAYLESQRQALNNEIEMTTFMFNQAQAQTDNKTVNCFLEATGVSAGIAIVGAFTGAALTKTKLLAAVKKMAKVVGKRTLGVVGLAIIVGEFTWCMNR